MADEYSPHVNPVIAEAQERKRRREQEFEDVKQRVDELKLVQEAEVKVQEDRRGLIMDTAVGLTRAIPGFFEETFDLIATLDEALNDELTKVFPDIRFGIDPRDPEGGNGFFTFTKPEAALFGSSSIVRTPETGLGLIKDLLPETERLTGMLAEPIGKFVLGFVTGRRALETAQLLQGATRMGRFKNMVAAGAVADTLAFDGHEGRLSDFLTEFDNPLMNNAVTQYLASNENDSELEGRMKNLLEGAALGAMFDAFFAGLRGVRAYRMNKAIKEAVKKADNAKMELTPEAPQANQVDDVLVHQANTPEDAASILKDGFDESRIGQSGVADEIQGFWFQTKAAGKELADGVESVLKPDARVRTFESEDEYFNYLSKQFGTPVTRENYISLVRDQDFKVSDEAFDAFRFGKNFDSPITPYDPGMVVVTQKKALGGRTATKEPGAAPTPEEIIVTRKAELQATVRSTVQITEQQQAAFSKALEAGDDEAAMATLKDFNEDTIAWDKIEDADDIKQVMLATEEVFAPMIDAAKGGVQSNAQLRMLANLVGANPRQVANLHQSLRDGGGIAAKFYSAYRTMLASAANVKRTARASLDAPGDSAKMANALRSVQVHTAIQAELKGAQTEIARAMQGMSLLKESAADNFREFDELKRQFAASGDGVGARAWNQQMEKLLATSGLHDMNMQTRMTRGQRAKNIFIEYTINSMLSSPKTHVINFASNVLNTVIFSMDRTLGASYRYLRHGDKAAMREARIDVTDKLFRMDEAWQLAKQAWRDGAPVTDVRQRIEFKTRTAISIEGQARDLTMADSAMKATPRELGAPIFARKTEFVKDANGDFTRAVDFTSWQRVINTLGRMIRIPGRALITGDEFFKAVNRNAEISVLAFRKADEGAIAKGLEYGSEAYEKFVAKRMKKLSNMDIRDAENVEIQVAAIEKARYVTFQEKPRSDFGANAERLVNSNAWFKLVFAPFFRTPMNILRQGVFDRTPLGLLFKHTKEVLKKGHPRDQAEITARMFTGMGAMAAFYGLTTSGEEGDRGFEIVGKVPVGTSAKEANIKDYSIRFGSLWFQFNRMEPFGLWLGAIADMRTAAKYNDDNDEWLFSSAQAVIGSFMNGVGSKTFMKSLTDFQDMLEGVDTGKQITIQRAIARFTAGEFGKLIPQFVKASARGLEGDDDSFQQEAWTMLDILAARSSLFNENLPDRFDTLGKLIPRDAGLSILFNPFTLSKASTDPVYKEFWRLGFDLKRIPKTMGSGGFDLNAEEYSKLTSLMAKTGIHRILTALITSDVWEGLTDTMKVSLIKEQITEARMTARVLFLAEPGIVKRMQDEKVEAITLLVPDDE